jgi:hypothetical protein
MIRAALRPNRSRVAVAKGVAIPAPVKGWNASKPLSGMDADEAVVLDNWIPRPGYVEARRGFTSHGTGLGSSVVDSLMVYHGLTSATSKIFACANTKIYDITVAGAGSDQSISTSNNRFQYTNFTTSGGKYLWCCNGAIVRHYNGSAWATPSLTISTYSASDIINVHGHKNRLWFVFKDSTVAGYLATGSVAGTVTNFELGGLFTKGGFLVAMATLTRDGGSGSDDFAMFISSQGQVAVYSGTDPADSELWSLVGVYDLGPPIGYRCFKKIGADLALINIDGLIPVSQALGLDLNAQKSIAFTANINDAMNIAARSYKANFGWQLTPYPRGTYALLNIPITEGSIQHQYVMNTLTGAWCRFKGMNANCWEVFRDEIYFGGNAGVVYKADNGGYDNTAAIDAVGQTAYNYLGDRAHLKNISMLQPLLTVDASSRPALGVSTDYKDNASLGTPSTAEDASALWDVAVWDVDQFAVESRSVDDWTCVSAIGRCASVHFRAQKDVASDTIMQLNGFNVIYQPGGFM